ncbi:MAG TPA: Bax inhibitor-1/YccA family protein [Acidimicrobiales bacterium]|nr:Bax inhibitor-1/YccA family protein [Acidimicrobiales bacterium]
MANPALNDKTFAPERLRTLGAPTSPTTIVGMTLDGVVLRCLVLFPVLLFTGWVGWQSVDRTEFGGELPGWLLPAVLVALAVALVTVFRPRVSPYTAPVYAAVEGLVLGAVSGLYEIRYEGIVLQAVMLTGAVFAIMLALYSKRIVKVDDRLRRGIVAATLAVMVVYLASMVMRLFGAEVPFIHDAGPMGILFSLVVVGIASANLLLDFDLIERGVAAGAPKWMEWYAAFGLLVTLVWLYLELLRLLSKLRSR